VQLRAQQAEVVVARRVQQRDDLIRGPDRKARVGLEGAELEAVAGDLGARA
jgi:hypothetical protein